MDNGDDEGNVFPCASAGITFAIMAEWLHDGRPERLVGCEVWRALDWMVDSDKLMMGLSRHENLQLALIGVFDSQIVGGKQYDLASMGRRRANATYFESHSVDETTGVNYGMGMTTLMNDVNLKPSDFIKGFLQHFVDDVMGRVNKLVG